MATPTNEILTISMITRESLPVLSGMLGFTGCVNRQYDDTFEVKGAKIGKTINIRKPARYVGRDGPTVNIEAQNETYFPLTLNHQWGVDLTFTSVEYTLSLDDFMERVAHPALVKIANMIDNTGLTYLPNVYNLSGTPGTPLTGGPSGTTLDTALAAGELLDNNLTARDGDRHMVCSPKLQHLATSNGLNLFNPQGKISEQYDDGLLAEALGFKWYMDQNMPSHTVGTYGGSPKVNTSGQSGASLITDGWTATTTSLNVGDVFTIAGVYAVNAQTQSPLGYLQQFVVTAPTVTDGSGNSTIAISPAIVTSGAFQNVSRGPLDEDVITVAGASGSTYQQSIAMHRNAFVFGCAALDDPKNGVIRSARESDPLLGLSIRMIEFYYGQEDQWITRFDILGGWAPMYVQTASRIALT